MVKVEVRISSIQIENKDIQEIYSGNVRQMPDDVDEHTPKDQIRLYRGAIIEVTKDVWKRLGMSVKRYQAPDIGINEMSGLTESQIKALEEIEAKKIDILGINKEPKTVNEVSENPNKKKVLQSALAETQKSISS